MKTYKVRFHRFNFGFDPPLEQMSDVVFQTDILLNDNIEEFEEYMWDCALEQNLHWTKHEGPIENLSGWSSVLQDGKINILIN